MIFDAEILSLDEPKLVQFGQESLVRDRRRGAIEAGTENADPNDFAGLLCPRPQRPRYRRAADQRDELAPSHARHGLPPSPALPPPIIPAGDRHGAVGLPPLQPAGRRGSRSLGRPESF